MKFFLLGFPPSFACLPCVRSSWLFSSSLFFLRSFPASRPPVTGPHLKLLIKHVPVLIKRPGYQRHPTQDPNEASFPVTVSWQLFLPSPYVPSSTPNNQIPFPLRTSVFCLLPRSHACKHYFVSVVCIPGTYLHEAWSSVFVRFRRVQWTNCCVLKTRDYSRPHTLDSILTSRGYTSLFTSSGYSQWDRWGWMFIGCISKYFWCGTASLFYMVNFWIVYW